MAKLNIGLIGSTVTAATATPTTFLMSNDSIQEEVKIVNEEKDEKISKEIEDSKEYVRTPWNGSKIPTLTKSSDIKKEHKKVECLKKHYENGGSWGNPSQAGSPHEDLIYSGDTPKGCLVVEYYKQTIGTEGKWWGGLRLVWSVVGNHRGLVTVFNINVDKEKLTLDSSGYILKKDLIGSTWGLSYAQENIKRLITKNNELSKYFPQPGNSMRLTGSQTKYWGLDPDIEKICKGSECSEESGTLTSMSWNWTKGETQTPITNWSSNFQSWFKELFSSLFQIKNQLEKLKGTWTKTT